MHIQAARRNFQLIQGGKRTGHYLNKGIEEASNELNHLHVEGQQQQPSNEKMVVLSFNKFHSSMGIDMELLKKRIFVVPKTGLYHFVFKLRFSFGLVPSNDQPFCPVLFDSI